MIHIRKSILSVLVLCATCSALSLSISAQTPEFYKTRSYDELDFEYNTQIIPDNTGENSTLNILTRIDFNRLQFVKKGNQFEGKYEVMVDLRDDDNEMVHGKSWEQTVTTDDFTQTISHKFNHVSGIQLPLEPGKYTLTIYLKDLETENSVAKQSNYEIKKNEAGEFRVTGILFVKAAGMIENNLTGIEPVVVNTLDKAGSQYYAIFDIIPAAPDERYSIEAEVKTLKRRSNTTVKLSEREESAGSGNVRVSYLISSEDFLAGRYGLFIKVKSGRDEVKLSKEFSLAWFGAPASEQDLDLALGQMKYAFDEVRDARLDNLSFEERLKLFREQWDTLDPSPGTDINELKDEYFRRVRYANNNFTVFRDGWKTDRGMIYILFGPPSEVARIPFASESLERQMWYYYGQNIQFEFFDRIGFGDLELVTPYDYNVWSQKIK